MKSQDVYHRWRVTLFVMWVTLGGLTCLAVLLLLIWKLGLT